MEFKFAFILYTYLSPSSFSSKKGVAHTTKLTTVEDREDVMIDLTGRDANVSIQRQKGRPKTLTQILQENLEHFFF